MKELKLRSQSSLLQLTTRLESQALIVQKMTARLDRLTSQAQWQSASLRELGEGLRGVVSLTANTSQDLHSLTTLSSQLQTLVTQVTARMDVHVFFSAGLETDQSVTAGDVIIFDQVITQHVQVSS